MSRKWYVSIILIMAGLFFANTNVFAEIKDIPLVVATQQGNVTSYNVSIKILAAVTLLTVLPALLITTTAFTRIIIVMAILRQAIAFPVCPVIKF